MVDISKINLTTDQKESYIEASYNDENNYVKIGSQIVWDATNDLKANLNCSISLDQSSSSVSAGKPEFGKNVFLIFKQFSVSFTTNRSVNCL